MTGLYRDLEQACRQLRRNPGFAAIGLIATAVGIGAACSIFSVVQAVLLKPLPLPDADRLVLVWERCERRGLEKMFASPPNFADWRDQNTVFQNLTLFERTTLFLEENGIPIRVQGARVNAEFFDVVGVAPQLGTAFTAVNDRPGGDTRVAVISNRLWKQRFGGRPDLPGSAIRLEGQSYVVVGVMPEGFGFPPHIALEGYASGEPVDIWVPLAVDPAASQRGAHYLTVLGRMRPQVGLDGASAEMNAVASRLAQQFPESNAGWDIRLVPLREEIVGSLRTPLWILMGAVGLLLLIACVNVANLLLTRSIERSREIALRKALGAGRLRIMRQFLAESVVLAMLGGSLGVGLSLIVTRLLVRFAPENLPARESISVDSTVLLFALALSFLTGLLFGLAPVFQSPEKDLSRRLREGSRNGAETVSSHRLRGILTVAEVALSLVLLVGAHMLFESFLNLRTVDTGFNESNRVTLRLTLPEDQFQEQTRRVQVVRELEQRLSAVPDIARAGFIQDIPLASDRQGTSFWFEDEPGVPSDEDRTFNFSMVSPGYFSAMEVPVLQGRGVLSTDRRDAEQVLVVNQEFVDRYLVNRPALGERIRVGFSYGTPRRIVGIVGNVRHNRLRTPPSPMVYVPYYQFPFSRSLSVVVETRIKPSSVMARIREEVGQVAPGIPVYGVHAMSEIVDQSVARERFSAGVLSFFSIVALILACVGIYGVMSYSVSRRRRETGVRMVLGALPSDILRLILGQGLKLAVAGVALGAVGSLLAGRLLSGLLFEVNPYAPLTLGMVSLLLTAVLLVACLLPARRATRVNPLQAIRYE